MKSKNFNSQSRNKILSFFFPQNKNLAVRIFSYLISWVLFPAIVFILICPQCFTVYIYETVYGNIDKIIPVIVGIVGAISAVKMYINENKRRAYLIGIPSIVIGIIGSIMGETVSDYYTYKNQTTVVTIDSLIETNTDVFRFTPGTVAYSEMLGSFNKAGFTIEKASVNPYYSKSGYGHVVQVVADDLAIGNKIGKKNPGWMVYNDTPNSQDKTTYIPQEITYGEGMLFFDNLMRKVAFTDLFASYDHPNHIMLEDQFVTVIPKIKYKYKFPCFLEDVWAGSVLVYPDGKIETLTPEQIIKDGRFKNQWMASKKLVRNYITLQNFNVGFINVLLDALLPMRIEGMIEISETEDNHENPFPHIYEGKDGKTYFSLPVDPKGAGQALSAYYYVNAMNSSEIKRYSFNAKNTVSGAAKALSLTYNIPGFTWYNAETKTGTHVPIDAAEIIKNQKLYWKVTVTTKDPKSRTVAATIVIDAMNSENVLTFTSRSQFEKWFTNGESATITNQNINLTKDIILQKIAIIKTALKEVELLLPMVTDTLSRDTIK